MKTVIHALLGLTLSAAVAASSAGARAEEGRQPSLKPRAPVPTGAPAPATAPWDAARWLAAHPHAGVGALTPTSSASFQMEPSLLRHIKQELLLFLATHLNEPSFRRAALTLPLFSSTLRADAQREEDDYLQRRATYIQIEEFKGTGAQPMSPATGAYAAVGGALFTGSFVTWKLKPGTHVSPQLWPAGARLSVKF